MDSKSRYTLRTDPVLLEKLGYIAEYEGRTKNRELEQMIKRHCSFRTRAWRNPYRRKRPLTRSFLYK